MARIAACLMLSGVGKSGSPALKSTTSTPVRRSLSASAMTFMVEDSLMLEMRSAMGVGSFGFGDMSCLLQSFAQALLNSWRNEASDVAAKADDLFYQF